MTPEPWDAEPSLDFDDFDLTILGCTSDSPESLDGA